MAGGRFHPDAECASAVTPIPSFRDARSCAQTRNPDAWRLLWIPGSPAQWRGRPGMTKRRVGNVTGRVRARWRAHHSIPRVRTAMVGTAQLRLCPPYGSRICYRMFTQGQSLEAPYALIGQAGTRCRNNVGRCVCTGPDLRSELPDMPADLWPERQLYCVWLYIDGAVQIVRVRPRGAVHHQSVLRGSNSGPNPAPTPDAVLSVRQAASYPSFRGAPLRREPGMTEVVLSTPHISR
jgi:hypothetical protein